MLPYSKEMRRDVLAACDRGEGTRFVALGFNCSESWVRRVKQERREQGKTAPSLTRRRTPKWEVYRERIVALIAQRPDLTLQELKDELQTSLSRQTLCTALAKLKLALKKSPQGRRAGSPGHRRTSRRVARVASRARAGSARIHRRNVGQD
jgi:transposase